LLCFISLTEAESTDLNVFDSEKATIIDLITQSQKVFRLLETHVRYREDERHQQQHKEDEDQQMEGDDAPRPIRTIPPRAITHEEQVSDEFYFFSFCFLISFSLRFLSSFSISLRFLLGIATKVS
jgi:hypothetical protein